MDTEFEKWLETQDISPISPEASYAEEAWNAAMARIPVRKMGNYGRAYDTPTARRAYSYKDQPDNQGAYRLGLAANNIKQPCGDLIDIGLGLLKELEAQGYGVFELERVR